MRQIFLMLTMISIFSTISLTAQDPPMENEKAEKNTVLEQYQKRLKRDLKELKSFQKKADQFNNAYDNRDVNKLNKTKSKLIRDMKREISQGNNLNKQYKKEIKESRQEIKDINKNSRTDLSQEEKQTSKLSKKLEQRDMKGDYKALENHKDILDKQKGILNAFKNYDFFYTADDHEKEKGRGLLNDFSKFMGDDIDLIKSKIDKEKKAIRKAD